MSATTPGHPNAIIRAGITADIPKLIQPGLLSYGQYAPLLHEDNWQKLRKGIENQDMWHSIIQSSHSFLYEVSGVVAGMAFLLPHGNAWDVYPDEWSYIRMVGVHPSYSGQGIATKLTMCCIEKARNTGEQIIALHTSEVMHAARHIYESLGFTIERAIADRFGLRYWLYKMELPHLPSE